MIGKVLAFVGGFILGVAYGTVVGRWMLEQLVNFISGRLG